MVISDPFPSYLDCIKTEIGEEYQGRWNLTATGKCCHSWDSREPEFTNATRTGIDGNYCRNPDSKKGVGPWCYTDDNRIVWESCGLPLCQGTVLLLF